MKIDKDVQMTMATAAMILALTVMPLDANAAMSGGRMGGSFSSSPRQSTTRSAPSSYSRGYSRGYSSGYSSRPSTTIITPSISPGFGFGYNPFFSPVTPFYGGPGVISYSRGPSFFDIAFFGAFLFAVTNIISKAGDTMSDGASTFSDVFDSATSVLGSGSSVVKLSVALDVPNRDDRDSILSVLDRLAQTAKTDSRVGIQNLTSQVALELLRRRSSISSASTSYKHYRDSQKASRDFQSKSVQERSKFEREGVSKFGGVDYSREGSSKIAGKGDGKATMAVVTLILNIDGDSTKVPKINSLSDVEEALRKIASDSKVDDCLQSAEILWTPEDRSESLSLGDVVADYPELRSV
jgi:uncharacterized membrane protein